MLTIKALNVIFVASEFKSMYKKRMLCCLGAIFVLCVLSSCKVKFDIPEKKMAAILADMHMADGVMDVQHTFEVSYLSDSAQIYKPILKKYGYTLENFRSALNQYMKNPKAFESVYKRVIKRLKAVQKQYATEESIPAHKGRIEQHDMQEYIRYEISIAGDTTMVWWQPE